MPARLVFFEGAFDRLPNRRWPRCGSFEAHVSPPRAQVFQQTEQTGRPGAGRWFDVATWVVPRHPIKVLFAARDLFSVKNQWAGIREPPAAFFPLDAGFLPDLHPARTLAYD
jgi:hypothetical protein